MNTVTLELNKEQMDIVLDFYEDFYIENNNPHAIARAKIDYCVITFFKSGKVVFQGENASYEASIWQDFNSRNNNNNNNNNDQENTIPSSYIITTHGGSDEVGTGDYFGPISVAATYVNNEDIKYLIELGVKDSKKLSDDKILEIAPKIISKIKYVQLCVDNNKYNELVTKGFNMNKIKAYLHNQALILLIRKNNLVNPRIIVDQFAEKDLYYSYLNGVNEVYRNIEFMTKAESISPAVAAASIIARYSFLKHWELIEKHYNITIPKGAGAAVDTFGQLFIKIHGIDEFKKICKYNFKNTEKILNSLNKLF